MVEIRFLKPDEMPEYRNAVSFGFGDDPSSDEAALERWLAICPAETSIAAFDRGHMVATFGSYDLDLTVPGGGQVAMAGTTHVTVHPTHRRQGILTKMMRMHLDQAIERGQPSAGLWASDERIYGRFGYAPAVYGHELKVPARTVETPAIEPDLSVHPLTVEETRSVLPEIYDRQLLAVAGRLARTEPWWEARRFYEPPSRASGLTSHRFVVVERDGVGVGYLVFRLATPESWGEGTTRVIELLAADDAARRALWHFATNVDLFRNVVWWNAPIDDPLLIEADRFREISRSVLDSLWLRPLDVPAMLTTRRYERDGALVLGIHDSFGPTGGRYRLEVAGGEAACEATTDSPDVELAVEDLARLFMGGGSAFTLQRAGLVSGDPTGVRLLDELFNTRMPPHCLEVF